MKRRMFSAADVAATLQDAPREQTVRTRTTVTYDDYVLRYARAQRFNVLLAATGAAVVAGAVVYLSGAVVVIPRSVSDEGSTLLAPWPATGAPKADPSSLRSSG